MGFSWTKEQEEVISTEDCSILVPAAAGSGKTAVLVARILRKIKDGMDVDRLLVVTFTRAAAAEMKERLEQEIEATVADDPTNAHLCRQLTLIHYASIMTIDSFCMSVVQNHFHVIQLEPGFRVADEGELKLLQEDVIAQLMEDHYAVREDGTKDEVFRQFVDAYSPSRDDSAIGEMILNLYRMAVSYPWPERWLEECASSCDVSSMEELEEIQWMQFLKQQIAIQLDELNQMFQKCLEICQESDGPEKFLDTFEPEARAVQKATTFTTFSQAWEWVDAIAFGRKPRLGKKDTCSPQKAEAAAKLRNDVRDGIKQLKKQFFFQPMEEMLENIKQSAWAVHELVDLTKEFRLYYRRAKEEKNILDFSDLEHMALDILLEHTDGGLKPSKIAKQYQAHFQEIMVDEYQDSNLVQEVLLSSISKDYIEPSNLFMVGDVKQSIYKFRLARPELFMEKYNKFTVGSGKKRKIELHQNFRSRAEVLEGINLIFYQIMTQKLGDIPYTKESALYPSAMFAPTQEKVGGAIDFCLLDLEDTEENMEDEMDLGAEGELNGREWEAMLLAKQIQALVHPVTGQFVWDKEEKVYRRAQYQDIVILLRTMSGWAENLTDVLMSQGIPTVAESRSGYFNAMEVQTVLNLLRVINNPRQDIPLAAVLHSPISGFSSEEIATIHVFAVQGQVKKGLYQEIQYYLEHKDNDIASRMKAFFQQLDSFRHQAEIMSLRDLLWNLLETTGYYHYAYAMPAGEKRRANLDMLVQKAEEFEKTSYKGLFQFVRYIEKLQKYAIDFGEASAVSQMNCVRIMSIHKSKGLEFPIVILAGGAKAFNQQDTRRAVAFQADFGVGMDCVRVVQRTKSTTLAKKAVQRKILIDNLGEELRVLYVAMTRAKEKLIVTAACKNPLRRIEDSMDSVDEYANELPFIQLSSANCYLDFLLPAVLRHQSLASWWNKLGKSAPTHNPYFLREGNYTLSCVQKQELGKEKQEEEQKNLLSREMLRLWKGDEVEDAAIADEIEERFSWKYQYEPYTKVNVAMSVSELKRKSLDKEDAVWQPILAEKEPTVPKFLQTETKIEGAARGTIYHTVFQALNFEALLQENDMEEQLERMVVQKILTEEEKQVVRIKDFAWFARQTLCKRIARAQQRGQLFKEYQFLMGIPSGECGNETVEDMVMVKGIIDLYFIEDDEIVLLDYKTDRVNRENGEEVLKKRYRTQLALYAKALENAHGKRVKEKILYSVSLGKSIYL